MKKRFFWLVTIFSVVALVVAACGGGDQEQAVEEKAEAVKEVVEEKVEEIKEAVEEKAEEMKEEMASGTQYGQITDVGGIDDKGFNQLAWDGLQRAGQDLGADVQFLQSQQQTDYEKNIAEFLNQGYNGLVTVGFLLADATKAASEANPDIPFAIVDFPSQTSGDMGLLFAGGPAVGDGRLLGSGHE